MKREKPTLIVLLYCLAVRQQLSQAKLMRKRKHLSNLILLWAVIMGSLSAIIDIRQVTDTRYLSWVQNSSINLRF